MDCDSTKEEANADTFLFENKCNPKYLGYFYTREILLELVTHKQPISCKVLYDIIAKRYKSSSNCVERCIRTFIEVSWEHLELFKKRPSNKEFFAICLERSKRIKINVDNTT